MLLERGEPGEVYNLSSGRSWAIRPRSEGAWAGKRRFHSSIRSRICSRTGFSVSSHRGAEPCGTEEPALRAHRTVPLLQMVFLALSFPEKSAGLLAAVRALLAFCLPPTRAVSFVLTSPHRTFAGGSGPPRGFNPRQVPNPRMERYTDPKALHDRRRSEPEWGTLSNAIVRHPPPARRPVA